MWINKGFKQEKFKIDILEKNIEDYILKKYELLASYSSKGAIIIHIGIYSEIFLSIINSTVCEITFKQYDESEVKQKNPLGKNSSGSDINLETVWKVEIYDSYEDIIENIENFINMYNDDF
jgi:hypothetical protein